MRENTKYQLGYSRKFERHISSSFQPTLYFVQETFRNWLFLELSSLCLEIFVVYNRCHVLKKGWHSKIIVSKVVIGQGHSVLPSHWSLKHLLSPVTRALSNHKSVKNWLRNTTSVPSSHPSAKSQDVVVMHLNNILARELVQKYVILRETSCQPL